ncbi:MAG: hypothetical protein V1808_01110 [Candidatus Daviesbacteria bacterium]
MTNRDILLKILELIGYEDDKETFVSEFERNIKLQSIVELIKSLPEDKQGEIKQEFEQNKEDSEKIAEVVKKYFDEAQMEEALKNASKNAITNYFQAITSTLSEEQKENLNNYFKEIEQNNPQAAV